MFTITLILLKNNFDIIANEFVNLLAEALQSFNAGILILYLNLGGRISFLGAERNKRPTARFLSCFLDQP